MVQALSVFFLALIPFFFSGFTNALIDLLNIIISMLGPAAINVIGMFPPNPCLSTIASCSDVAAQVGTLGSPIVQTIINLLAWVFPMQFLANLIGCVLMSIMCYFLIAPLARWFKLIT